MANFDFVVVIPARFGSSRLPGKPLADIAGLTMIERVYRQALLSDAKQVVIATDDQRVVDCVNAFGGAVCMTRSDHESGTDRLAEVAEQFAWSAGDIVVNVQGDEPLIPPEVINQVAALMAANDDADMCTLAEPIERLEDVLNPNIVKVVAALNKQALYFSRAPIPWDRDAFSALESEQAAGQPALKPALYRRHIGIYAYRVALLQNFVAWPATQLEQTEKLEQLRAMEQGSKIYIEDACALVPGGVDTQADLDAVRDYIAAQS